jgi:oligoribonuclease (3'-5' exoribonuclease)
MKKSKQYFLLPLDLETTGFNGIQEVDGKLVNGADHFDIMQIAYQVVDPVDMMPYISNDYFIDVSDEGIARMNPSTREFHDTIHEGSRISFNKLYAPAYKVEYAQAEASIINALKEVLAVKGHTLEPYAYGQSYEIVLLGKSCQFDRDFLRAKMPNLSRYLSHLAGTWTLLLLLT